MSIPLTIESQRTQGTEYISVVGDPLHSPMLLTTSDQEVVFFLDHARSSVELATF
jgi:hypothetical protein